MQVITICGSNCEQSINRKLLQLALNYLPYGQYHHIDMQTLELPIYGQDHEREQGIPCVIKQAKQLIDAADGILIASPEHNGFMTAALKNLFDWLSRADTSHGAMLGSAKPCFLLSASPGNKGGSRSLRLLAEALPHWGGQCVAQYSLGGFYQAYENGKLNENASALLQVQAKKFEAAMATQLDAASL